MAGPIQLHVAKVHDFGCYLPSFILTDMGKEVIYKRSCFITGLKSEFLYPKMAPIINPFVGLKSSQKNTHTEDDDGGGFCVNS